MFRFFYLAVCYVVGSVMRGRRYAKCNKSCCKMVELEIFNFLEIKNVLDADAGKCF